MNNPKRNRPNILITGTPGTGKSSLAESIASSLNLNHFDIGKLVKEKELYEGWDDEFQCWIIDEDKVIDELDPILIQGGCVVDHHTSEWFPERWFDLVVVLRADIENLNERYEKRNYSQIKITNNIDCEIMQVCLDEAIRSYDEKIIKEMTSNSIEDNEENQNTVGEWYNNWMQHNQI
ncbi:hypothetical protein CYY_002222 [Polysphondylium violaceum]|uniref:Adenylate kinase isoenzyme 6 homolog n=1 Tax=Polysphondylium violaceum TaxID=133409 RepID=A0A8J4Q1N8_9MYCE|nr:hypothetical protein CYY_002222 [Polysphondylium violaceum]